MSVRRSSHPIRVAVINDYPVVTAGVTALMADFADRVVLRSPVDAYAESEVDVILFDTFGRDRLLARLAELAGGRARVVVFTACADPDLIGVLLEGGAVGFVHNSASAEILVEAIEAAHRGTRRTFAAGGYVVDALDVDWPGKRDGLTARESEMLAFVAQGLTNEEIAARSFLSINTVKTHLRTGYRKIGVARRTQAVSWGIRNGMVPSGESDRPVTPGGESG